MKVVSFRSLEVWQRAMMLVEHVYQLTADFPRHEQFGLTSQARRAAVSIASNIAEGQRRKTGHYLEHLDTALGSEAELQTQLELAYRLKFVSRARVIPLLRETAEIGRMLRGLSASVAAGQRERSIQR